MKVKTAVRLMQAQATMGEVSHDEIFDREIAGFSIDSRTVEQGELLFALSPEDYGRHGFNALSFTDAHQFIPQAFERGAIAAVARRERVRGDAVLEALSERLFLVDDAIEALQLLGQAVIRSWDRPVIGITGSAGKTTTKDLTAHVLQTVGRRVLKSKKNFNNELGLPLSILQMETGGAKPEDYTIAVLEMGMSTPNELRRLCQIAPPDVGVELLVAPVHLEFFGTIENIAAAKAQLVEGIKPGGTAILNADDELVSAMRSKHRGPTLTFGIENPADVMAIDVASVRLGRSTFHLRTPLGETDVELPLPGRHNLMNALAAAAVATVFDIAPQDIAEALASAAPSQMRGEMLYFAEGFLVVDDSYNSNPRSLISMVGSLASAESGRVKRRIVVAGEMLELGPESARMHFETGREIARAGIDILWGVRGNAQLLIEGAREAGMGERAVRFFESSEEAAAALIDEIRDGDLVLVKGSRGVQTDKVIKLLKESYKMTEARG